MIAADTSAAAQHELWVVYSSMSGEERLMAAMEMADLGREVALAGIRDRNPDLDERSAEIEWVRMLRGDTVAEYAAACSNAS